VLCDGAPLGCPPAPPEGGAPPCQYALEGLINQGFIGPSDIATFTIEVSKPGFESAVVPGVATGVMACPAPNTPASQVTVKLSPLDGAAGDGAAGQ
jgi:hypothetical protein